MIWAVTIIEAGLIALCVYQIRELTGRIHFVIDTVSRTIAVAEKINGQLQEVAEQVGLQQIRVSNNEHRIRDIYRAINELKGWPGNDLSE